MSNKIIIKEVEWKEERLLLIANNDVGSTVLPTGRMLADSDGLAFIYILESTDDYVYISIPVEHWPYLKEALALHAPVLLRGGHNEIILEGMEEELLYLISNINGNVNYGMKMVEKVESVFL